MTQELTIWRDETRSRVEWFTRLLLAVLCVRMREFSITLQQASEAMRLFGLGLHAAKKWGGE